MTNLAKIIHNNLLKENKTVSVAESCTGGLIAKTLTGIPGSSGYFILGVVAYSNESKTKILGIPAELIAKKGAASRTIAEKMADAIRRIAKTDYGLGVTGIAGPSGGFSQKPVGTVFIAISNGKKTICKKFLFRGKRLSIRNQACFNSLKLLRSSF
ncbi:MAG: CinA family protein [Candidatus Omnitrophota bacterium]|jgi:nicotinamide-nucleotide amidase